MAKSTRQTSLCVAEYPDSDSKELKWRRLADYFALPGREPQFYAYNEEAAYLNVPNHIPTLGAIKLFSYTPPETPSEVLDTVHVVTSIRPTVVLRPREMSETVLEDENSLRRLLHSGFTIHKNIARAFSDGQVMLATITPSRTGRARALLFDDKSKLKLKPADHKSFFVCSIEPEPLNSKHFTEKLDIIDLESDDLIEYLYPGHTSDGWTFLSKQPKLVKNASLSLYTPEEYAPIYLKRCLAMAPETVRLQNDRKLTKSDIGAVLSYLQTAIQSDTSVPETLSLSDPAVIQSVKTYLSQLIAGLEADDSGEDLLLSQMQALLWASDKVRKDCVDKAREDWMKTQDPKRQAIEQLLASEKSIRESISLAEARLKDLNDERGAVQQDIASLKNSLAKSLDGYKTNVARLLADHGAYLAPLPIVTEGDHVPNAITEDDALAHNLSLYFDGDIAEGLAAFIEEGVCRGMHLLVSGHYAEWLANVISISVSGTTAAAVTRADAGCVTNAVLEAIQAIPTLTVLVNGVVSCAEDAAALAIARNTAGHTLVFSLDDPAFKDQLSRCLFDRMLYIPDSLLATAHPAHEGAWQVNERRLVPGTCTGFQAPWPVGPSQVFNDLAKAQAVLRSGDNL